MRPIKVLLRITDMDGNDLGILERFLTYNRRRVNRLRKSRKLRWIFWFSPKMRRLYAECGKKNPPERENAALAALLNAYEEGPVWRTRLWTACALEDLSLFFRQFGKRKTIDRSVRRKKDYYSVAVIVKNEARYIREYILFNMAAGADRIYVYDNDSSDGLLEALAPFLDTGYVVYRKWPGHKVQTGAYRDAVRRTRRRTKWLALVDADEFLFSPQGTMPGRLRAYEKYSGVGVNWLVYGPNGHDRRPEGLVMDLYTTTLADYNSQINCHIKSIVRPAEVFCVSNPHYAVYKGRGYAVGEDGVPLDNRSTRALSLKNNREIFRINHYLTRSLEDLEEKCARGRADGSRNPEYASTLRQIDYPMTEDVTIRPYADLVRKRYVEN